jgi:hypothetical protein
VGVTPTPQAQALIAEIDDVIGRAGAWSQTSTGARDLDYADRAALTTSWVATIERLSAPSSAYVANARALLKNNGVGPSHPRWSSGY